MEPIRLAAPDDLALLVTMMAEFYAESGMAFDRSRALAALQQLVVDPALGRVWLVRADDQSVGYVAVTFGYSLEYHGRDAFVDEIYLRAPHRGGGLGGEALAAVIPRCRQLGIRALHLEVERDNAPAQALYRRLGFGDNDRQLLTLRLEDAA